MKLSLLFLTWIALSTTLGVGFAYSPYGLVPWTAAVSLGVSLVALLIAVLVSPGQMLNRLEKIQASGVILAILFLAFAIRAFSQVIFVEDGVVKVLSPNNLGDICLHLTQINFLASNPHYWPENPIYAFDKLRYPIGIDIFNAELKLIGISPNLGIVLVAFLGSLLTLRALFLFGGPFAVAAFLFNGGLVGFMIFESWPWHLQDYQADVGWKSIPLALFVTQRGLLYSIPAGLVLITHWRRTLDSQTDRPHLPFWGEWLLYSTMPLFHIHTFIFLSFLLLWWFLFGNPNWRGHLIRLVVFSFVPATFFACCVTGLDVHLQEALGHLAGKESVQHGTSLLGWQPGWTSAVEAHEYWQHFWWFRQLPHGAQAPMVWLLNFGLVLPLAIVLLLYLCFPKGIDVWRTRFRMRQILLPAVAMFILCAFIRFAPWDWDNTKLFFWSYMLMMLAIWEIFLSRWHPLIRIPFLFGLFFSGFISLVGGLAPNNEHGYGIGDEEEWTQVDDALKAFPAEAVFAIYPTYNHPALVAGHRVVLGFPGHLWSHGLEYRPEEQLLNKVMLAEPGWEPLCRQLDIDYLFWGRFEQEHYPNSARSWENCPLAAQGDWGKVYDLRAITKGPTTPTAKSN
jgi:hypothetical protein